MMSLSLLLSFAIPLFPAVTALAGPMPDRAKVDAVVRGAIHDPLIPVAVGLISAGGTAVYGYGRVSDATPVSPDGKTVFEIGSVSKAFTGLLLAQMAQRGEVRLDDPIARYLPERVRAPSLGGSPITLLNLATHTSGLPRMSPGAKRAKEQQTSYGVQDFYQFLPTVQLKSRPGEKFLYSNIGAGLLGQLLVARAGLPSYEELLTTRIAGPLGMRDTRVSWTADSWSRAAHQRGPRASGSPSGYVLLGGGAGGIKSTVDDLLKFEGAYLGFQKTGFGPALNMTLERRYARDTGESVGLLWNLDPRENLVSKDGKVNGHLAFLLFSRQKQAGVVICTTVGAKTRLKLLARKLLALLDSRPASAVAPANGSGPEEDSDDED